MNLPTKLPSLGKPRFADRSQKEAFAKRKTADWSVPSNRAVKDMQNLTQFDKCPNVSVDGTQPGLTAKNICYYNKSKQDRGYSQVVSPSQFRAVNKRASLTRSDLSVKVKPKVLVAQLKSHQIASSVFKVR